MMKYGYMNWGDGGFSWLGGLFWVVLLIDLILVGMWLWKKIQEK